MRSGWLLLGIGAGFGLGWAVYGQPHQKATKPSTTEAVSQLAPAHVESPTATPTERPMPRVAASTNKPWLGYWESEKRSKGGLGSALWIRDDGNALMWTSVLVEGQYEVKDGRMFFDGNPEGSSLELEGDRMVLRVNGRDDVVKTRVGEGSGIVGVWTYKHKAGGTAFERFGTDGTMSFRMLLGIADVRRFELGDGDILEFPKGLQSKAFSAQVHEGNLLVNGGEYRYVHVGSKPWYPMP